MSPERRGCGEGVPVFSEMSQVEASWMIRGSSALGVVGGASGMERGGVERGLERRQGSQDGSKDQGR